MLQAYLDNDDDMLKLSLTTHEHEHELGAALQVRADCAIQQVQAGGYKGLGRGVL